MEISECIRKRLIKKTSQSSFRKANNKSYPRLKKRPSKEMSNMNFIERIKPLYLGIALVLSYSAAALGSIFTSESIPTWYQTINKPAFFPPNYVFPAAWTFLYLIIAISWYLVLKQGWERQEVRKASYFFLIHLALNAIWTPLFFGAHQILLALIEIIALIAVTIYTAILFYKIYKTSAYLLVPYIAWLIFATVLNASILILN